MARAYLGPAGPRERLVVVAGESASATAEASRRLQDAAARLGVSSVLVHGRRETVDLELATASSPQIVLYDQGAVSEADCVRLRGSDKGTGADLLLWCPRPGRGPRWIYLLSMWVWSLQPRHIRCVVDHHETQNQELSALRYRLCKGLRRTGVGEGAELLRGPDPADAEASTMFYGQILQSLLSSSADSNGLRRVRSVRRAAAALLLSLLLVFGYSSTVRAQTSATVLVEIVDFAKAKESSLGGGLEAVLYHGPTYTLRMRPGVGVWSEEGGTLTLTSRRPDTRIILDGDPIDWGSGTQRISGDLVIHCDEYSAVFGRGRVEMLGDRVVIHPVIGGNPLSGKGGVFVSLLLAAIIFFLMWRANALQKRLDRPRQSILHR